MGKWRLCGISHEVCSVAQRNSQCPTLLYVSSHEELMEHPDVKVGLEFQVSSHYNVRSVS